MAVALLLAVVGALAVSAPAAGASELPKCGILDFSPITGPAGSGEYTCRLPLDEEQEARMEEGGWIAVYYPEPGGDRISWTVTAPLAHDAIGTAVPTSLSLSEGDVVTLTVHHRFGDPAAVGAPFVYPILDGKGWEGGFQTTVSDVPPQQPLGQPSVPAPPALAGPACAVPGLQHDSLRRARAQLRAAGCALGDVRRRPGASARSGHVVKQTPPPGTEGAVDLPVTVTLGAPPTR